MLKKGIYHNPGSDWRAAKAGVKCTVDTERSEMGKRHFVMEYNDGDGGMVSGKSIYWTWIEEENEFGPVSP